MNQESFDEEESIVKTQELLTHKNLNKALMNSLPYPAMLIRKDRRIITANKAAKEIGVRVDSFCWDTFGKKASISEENREYYEKNNTVPPKGIKCTFCRADEALISHKSINEKIPAGDITYDTFWIPLTEEVYLHYAIVL
ncbi:MAG: hypothetical protein HN366_08900 [Deltaproteobacteria bacterium]|jgi:hypothetical protein|nr:hypothetical protein [Deltaproteobacteria bacterium]